MWCGQVGSDQRSKSRPCKTRLRILLLDLKISKECEKENTNTYQMIFVIDFLLDTNECEGGLINWALPRYCDPDCIAIIQGNGLWKGNPFYFGKHPFQEIFRIPWLNLLDFWGGQTVQTKEKTHARTWSILALRCEAWTVGLSIIPCTWSLDSQNITGLQREPLMKM